MNDEWAAFVQSQTRGGADGDGVSVGCEGLRHGAAVVDRSDRALLEITGADRATWLHNLTSNEVKNLGSGEGNYAFVLSAKGRILFDVNICVRTDSILLDLDAQRLAFARQHFEKYTITEDVALHDRTDAVGRFGLTGPMVPTLLDEISVTQVSAMPSLGTRVVPWSGGELTIIRHDFCGALGVEVIAEPSLAKALWTFLTAAERDAPAVVVDRDAINIARIEAGIPWPPHEINDAVLPAETGQLERAVSYQKGCYLGQEVVERMRSRGAMARKLCGLVLEGATIPECGSDILDAGGHVVGSTASACKSPAREAVVALAYVKTAAAESGTKVHVVTTPEQLVGTVSGLPFTE